jgi:glyoxylase-like metal-dependent hydrolase (beta-lactamase superfamily II)
MKSIFEKLMVLDGDIKVFPGHGPSTDIATERNTNPFLMPFNEPLED